MALPNPSQGQPREGTFDASGRYIPVRYNPATFRESVSTGLRAGLVGGLAKTAERASASTFMRMIGTGVLADTLGAKRREMLYEKGRDPETGRKLSRQELEEREMRKASYGTMADIKENVVLIAEMLAGTSNSILKNLGGGGTEGKPKTLAPGETGKRNVYQRQTEETEGFGLADEEAAEEREREDDQDQLESEARQQGFFTKLFKTLRLGGDGEEPGWMSKLLSGIGSLFSTVASNLLSGLANNLLGGLLARIGLGGLVGGAGRAAGAATGAVGRGAGAATGAVGQGAGQATGSAARGTAQATQQTGVVGRLGRGLGRAVGTGKNLAVGAAKTAGGWMSSAWGAIKSVGSKAIGAVSNLSPIKAIKEYIKPIASKFLPKLLAIPAIGTALTAILSAVDIQGIKKDPALSKEEKKKQIGTVLGSSIGSVIGGVGGGALGTLLGPLGTIGGAIGGSLLGSYVGEAISEALGPEKIFDIAESIPLLGNLLTLEEETAMGAGGERERLDAELDRERRELGLPRRAYKDENDQWVVPPFGKSETAKIAAKQMEEMANNEVRLKRELQQEGAATRDRRTSEREVSEQEGERSMVPHDRRTAERGGRGLDRERSELGLPKRAYKDENGNWVVPPLGRSETAKIAAKQMEEMANNEVRLKRELQQEAEMADARLFLERNMVPPSRKDGTDLILGSEENAGLRATPPTAAISAPQTNVVNTNNSVGIAPPPNAVRPSGADYAPRYQGGGLRYAF